MATQEKYLSIRQAGNSCSTMALASVHTRVWSRIAVECGQYESFLVTRRLLYTYAIYNDYTRGHPSPNTEGYF